MTLSEAKAANSSPEPSLKRNATAYQKIVMPDGTVTGGRFDRSITADVIFPDDMSGETYLDIGTMEGFFPFDALRRGAKHATGLDMNPNYVHNANVLAQQQGLPADFHLLDIDSETPSGKYDYVSMLNVLHHVMDPLEVIQKLISVTRKKLILEVAGLGPHERKKLGISRLTGWFVNQLPLIYVRRDALVGNRQKFFVSSLAMQNYLMGHRYVFSDVEIIPSPFKGRYIAVAHRRRFKRLILVAGPTSCGAQELLGRLSKGQAKEVSDGLNMGDSSSWNYHEVTDFSKTKQAEFENVVVHVDFLDRLKRNISDYRKLQFIDLIRCADDVQVLTLGVEPSKLARQFKEQEIEPYVRTHGKQPTNPTLKTLSENYQHPGLVREYYQHWFKFLKSQKLANFVLSCSDQPSLMDSDEWDQSVCW